MISVTNLTKSFGGTTALKNVNLEINRGEFVVLYGPNGAGKSTLLKILSRVMKPSSGTIKISDTAAQNTQDIRRIIGFVSHETYLYDNLTAFENLIFFGRLYGIKNTEDRVKLLLDKINMTVRANDLVKHYSHGMKQRIALCRSIIHNPEILFLDEPFNGLDLPGINLIVNLLDELKSGGKTILIATHNHELSAERAERSIVIINGEIVINSKALIPRDELNKIYSSRNLSQ